MAVLDSWVMDFGVASVSMLMDCEAVFALSIWSSPGLSSLGLYVKVQFHFIEMGSRLKSSSSL